MKVKGTFFNEFRLKNKIQFTNLPKEHIIRLVLDGHEHDEYSVEELQALERRSTHVEKYAEQNRHGNVTQHWGQQHRASDHQENQNVSGSLLADSQELRLLTGRRAL